MNIWADMKDFLEHDKNIIKHQMEARSFQVANELRNCALEVLRGQRSGRRYKVPGTYRRQRDKTDGKMKNGRYYTASAPGEPPAVRTGAFRLSWQPSSHVVYGSYIARISSDIKTDNGQYTLGEILENGTSRMAPRPYQDEILEKAKPRILRIYNEPYF
jgi:hypothetical protein